MSVPRLPVQDGGGPKPYYQDSSSGITLYHGDALEILSALSKVTVDLIVTDPPYGVAYQGRRRQGEMFAPIAGDESTEIAAKVIALAWPLLQVRRHAYAFGPVGFDFPDASRNVELIWDKCMMGMGDISLPWAPAHEPINFACKIRPAEKERESAPARMRKGSVLRVPRPNGLAVKDHPTEKPVALLRELIESSSRIGETVLDPFLGSGSTAVAALAEGRKCIGIEIEERYCEVAARRLSALSPNVGLFAEEALA